MGARRDEAAFIAGRGGDGRAFQPAEYAVYRDPAGHPQILVRGGRFVRHSDHDTEPSTWRLHSTINGDLDEAHRIVGLLEATT